MCVHSAVDRNQSHADRIESAIFKTVSESKVSVVPTLEVKHTQCNVHSAILYYRLIRRCINGLGLICMYMNISIRQEIVHSALFNPFP